MAIATVIHTRARTGFSWRTFGEGVDREYQLVTWHNKGQVRTENNISPHLRHQAY